jgi:putative ABC transport system substrate-binding protein
MTSSLKVSERGLRPRAGPLIYCVRFVLPAVISFFILAYPLLSIASDVAILVSGPVRPYLEAIDGLAGILSTKDVKTEVFGLERYQGALRKNLSGVVSGRKWDLLVAVGPNAAIFLDEELAEDTTPALYTMILNPAGVVKKKAFKCGVSLDIPVEIQIEFISRALPGIRRLGLLYDPAHNDFFFEKAMQMAGANGLGIHPIKVSTKKDIPSALATNIDKIDSIWMIPDRTVISESIIEYVIKESLLRKKPTIGFNRFFYENGAAAAFVFDYKEIGAQTGELLLSVIGGAACENPVPKFRLWLNPRTSKVIELTHPTNLPSGVEWGP